jgi:hypothetical protein
MQDEDFVAHSHQPEGAAPGLDPLYGIGIRVTRESPAPRPDGDRPGPLARLRSTATGLLVQAVALLRR